MTLGDSIRPVFGWLVLAQALSWSPPASPGLSAGGDDVSPALAGRRRGSRPLPSSTTCSCNRAASALM